MTILVTGATGRFGSLVVEELARRHAPVKALGRTRPDQATPDGVEFVTGDVLDVDFMRGLLASVDTVFLLNPAVPDEATRSLLTLSLIAEAGIQRLVYLSMMGVDDFVTAPRAAAKHVSERSIRSLGLPTTILRANAAFQNDLLLKDAIVGDHVYSTPLGSVGVTLIDSRDVAEVAALELLRRANASEPPPTEVIEIVGPTAFTGPSMAALWSELLGETVRYVGDDLAAVENGMRRSMSAADAYDLSLVFRPLVRDGVLGAPGAADRLVEMLGRPLQSYRNFAQQLLA